MHSVTCPMHLHLHNLHCTHLECKVAQCVHFIKPQGEIQLLYLTHNYWRADSSSIAECPGQGQEH